MSKALRIIFYILSVVLVAAMVVACATVAKDGQRVNNDSKDNSSTDSVAESVENADSSRKEEESVPDAPVSSEDSSAEESSTEESSQEESSVEESSEDESTVPDDSSSKPESGTVNDDPIVNAPSGMTTDEVDAFFNDSVFVGHSVMVHFSNYVGKWRGEISGDILGNARFCCTSSFSFYNNQHQTPSTPDNVLPKFRGQAYNIEDLPEATGSTTIYIGLMGLNDLGMCSSGASCADETAERVIECLETIKEKNPDVTIAVLASTYLTRSTAVYPKLNNTNMSKLNNLVLDYCNKNGVDFIDVATPITDGDGYLAAEYSSDDYCHLKQKTYFIWMDVLRDYASKKQAGSWSNPDSIPMFGE